MRETSNGHQTKKDSFVLQAGVLAVAGIIVRLIGILYRAPLTHIIGDEGNGYYTHAYNIYTIILLIASYSIPSAMSKVVSQHLALGENKNAMRIVRMAFLYVVVVGGAASLLTWIFAPFLVESRSVPVLRIFTPTIFLSGILGVLRGFFQSLKTMVPTSVSQILEQILNATVSVSAAWLLIRLTTSTDKSFLAMRGAMGSALGTGCGVLIAFIFLAVTLYRYKDRIKASLKPEKEDYHLMDNREVLKVILTVVTPFILSTFIYNFSTSLNQTIYTKIMKLHFGMSEARIATNYGIFAGKAVVLANIPIALASAMSSAIIPSISSAYAAKDLDRTRQQVDTAIRATMLISIPSAIGLAALAQPVTRLLFPQKESLETASLLLMSISITVVFYALSTLTNAVLQGIGKVNTPVHHATAALIVQTFVLVLLLRRFGFGLYSLSMAMIVYSFLMCVLNQIAVRKALSYKQEIIKTFIIPTYAAMLMGTFAHVAYRVIYERVGSSALSLLCAILIAVGIYLILVLRTGGITRDEIRGIPKGAVIEKVLDKTGLLRAAEARFARYERHKKFIEEKRKQRGEAKKQKEEEKRRS
ncbi:MAG: polysaccharide biosynthesis protein [Lachnospiraceae bacterium]|nr:polysaccharide biosynthesis protein [Lachnospiraceae bacterium]